jgi:predicted porin
MAIFSCLEASNISPFRTPAILIGAGFWTLGCCTVLPGAVDSTAYTNAKILRIFWTGAKYAIQEDLDVAAGYYHYFQNDYNTKPCTEGGLSASSCAGTLNAVFVMIDYRPKKRLDVYAGVMWSQVAGGLASGYLNHENIGPTVGMRLQF